MKRLAIITTHPIQYNAPLFRMLNERKNIQIKVYYTWGQSKDQVFDVKFGMHRSWDIPLLEGYESEFVSNSSNKPDSNSFWGVINPGLVLELKRQQYDAILVYRWSVYSHFNVLQAFGGKPKLFFRGDSHLLHLRNGIRSYLKRKFLQFIYRNVDKAFYVGKHNKDYYLQIGFSGERLLYAPHAIDNTRFLRNANKLETQAITERLELKIPVNSVVFLYAGKFYEVKQLVMLISAFTQVRGDEYKLLLVGNGSQEQELKALAKDDDRIIFQPFRNQSEMPLVYRLGDVFVLPSKSETWGLGVNEAMACGRPAIVSDACGCAPDLIKEGETGFVFDHRQENKLVIAMQQFTSKEMARSMGEHAFEHIQQFSLERVAEVVEGIVNCE